MVISASFDIYLCDNCDAELYSYGAMVVSIRSLRSNPFEFLCWIITETVNKPKAYLESV